MMYTQKPVVLFIAAAFLLVLAACSQDTKIDLNKYGNCNDQLQNQNEEGIDCGGYCKPCANCSDGVKNQDETGIDCGGSCRSCTPGCTVAPSTVEYTLTPPQSSGSYINDEIASRIGDYYTNSSRIEIPFNGVMDYVQIAFLQGFNPLTYLSVHQTMVFTTVDPNEDISNRSKVKVIYSYGSFDKTTNVATRGQLVYITKTDSITGIVKFCELKSGAEQISLNAVFLK